MMNGKSVGKSCFCVRALALGILLVSSMRAAASDLSESQIEKVRADAAAAFDGLPSAGSPAASKNAAGQASGVRDLEAIVNSGSGGHANAMGEVPVAKIPRVGATRRFGDDWIFRNPNDGKGKRIFKGLIAPAVEGVSAAISFPLTALGLYRDQGKVHFADGLPILSCIAGGIFTAINAIVFPIRLGISMLSGGVSRGDFGAFGPDVVSNLIDSIK